jgi:hypothetical protein
MPPELIQRQDVTQTDDTRATTRESLSASSRKNDASRGTRLRQPSALERVAQMRSARLLQPCARRPR